MTLLAVTRPGACPTSLQKNGLGKLYRLALNAKLTLYEARAEAKGASGSPSGPARGGPWRRPGRRFEYAFTLSLPTEPETPPVPPKHVKYRHFYGIIT
jgi:hypothetical protein